MLQIWTRKSLKRKAKTPDFIDFKRILKKVLFNSEASRRRRNMLENWIKRLKTKR